MTAVRLIALYMIKNADAMVKPKAEGSWNTACVLRVFERLWLAIIFSLSPIESCRLRPTQRIGPAG
jgi:hypothetical protein